MAINKVSGFKAAVKAAETEEALSKAEAVKLQNSVKEALKKIADIKENIVPQDDEFFGTDEKNEIAYREALLLADYNILDHYIKTGEMLDAAGVEAATTSADYIDLTQVTSGFYTFDQENVTESTVAQNASDAAGVENYAGTVYVSADSSPATDPTTGKIIPTNLNYVMSDDPEKAVVSGKMRMKGSDAIMELVLKDGTKQSFVIKNLGARTDVQLTIIGTKQKTGFTFDASNFVSVDPATGAKRGIVVLGSQGNDTIIGTVANDLLMGGGGSDKIFGGSGTDQVYGYANDDVLDTYGEDNLGTDGDDIIYDIESDDYIDGGPDKTGDSVFRGKSTGVQNPLTGVEYSGQIQEGTTDPSYAMEWVSASQGWTATPNSETGELVLTLNDESANAKLSIDMLTEEGFTIVGEVDGNGSDALFTAYKMENGEPVYYKIRAVNFTQSNSALEVKNGIIDLSALDVGAKEVTLQGSDSLNGDIIIDGQSIFDQYALAMEDLKSNTSTLTDAELEQLLSAYDTELSKTGDPIWYNATADGGVINVDSQYVKDKKFDIPTSFGSAVFVRRDANYTYVTVASNIGNTSSRVVFKINTADTKDYTFTQNGMPISIYEVGTNPGTTVDGGEGTDFIVAHTYGATIDDASGDQGIDVTKNAVDHTTSTSSGTTVDDIATEIGDATTYEELNVLYKKVSAMSEGDDKDNLLDAIDTQAVSLFDSIASDITSQCDTLENVDATKSEKSSAKSKITEDSAEIENLISIMKDSKEIKEDEWSGEIKEEISAATAD